MRVAGFQMGALGSVKFIEVQKITLEPWIVLIYS
jgi:hypothetical protein